MTKQNTVDVLVVGAGPAGASAALAAARAGLHVLCVDRKQQVGVPVQCAEFIPLPLSKYAQQEAVRLQHIAGMNSSLPSGRREHSELPGLMVDRAAFDQALASDAVRYGAILMLGTRFEGVDAERGMARFGTGQGDLDVGYRMLVAADGPHSAVAQALGLPPLETVHTRQYTVPLLEACADTDVWLSDDYPGGYAWLFPKGTLANIGLGVDRTLAHGMKQPLDALHRQLVEQGRVGEEIFYRTGGAIPAGGMRERLAVGNVLFVGDAAGLTHPITGAGIASAVVSGERAGEAAADWLKGNPRALSEFDEDMHDLFERVLRRAVERRQWLASRQRLGAAVGDEVHRKAWIAFPEYFETMV
jgi:geranylgeranyl reductase family protein